MNKEALFSEYSPSELLLGSALMGGGSFAAMRLLQDLMNQSRYGDLERLRPNQLSIDIPKEHQSIPVAPEKQAADFTTGLGSILGGGAAGVVGTKLLYDLWRKKQMKAEVDRAQQAYLQTLADVSKQASEETPNADALCEKIAEAVNATVEKEASIGTIGAKLMGLASKAKSGLSSVGNTLREQALPLGTASAVGLGTYEHMYKPELLKGVAPSNAAIGDVARSTLGGGDATKLWGSAAGGVSLLTLALLLNNHQKKLKKELKVPPSDVEVNYV